MKAYGIDYRLHGTLYATTVDASSLVFARRKIARQRKVSEEEIEIVSCHIVGYY